MYLSVDFSDFSTINSIFPNNVSFSCPALSILSVFSHYSDRVVGRLFSLVSFPPHPHQVCWSYLEYIQLANIFLEILSALTWYFMCPLAWLAHILKVQHIQVWEEYYWESPELNCPPLSPLAHYTIACNKSVVCYGLGSYCQDNLNLLYSALVDLPFFFSFFYLPHSTELYICFILNASSLNLRKVLLILYNVPLRRCLKKYLLTKCLIWAF